MFPTPSVNRDNSSTATEGQKSVLIKLSISEGGGFLKLCLSIFNINDPCSKSSTGLSKRFLESGVKRVLIIGLVLEVSEHYVNV